VEGSTIIKQDKAYWQILTFCSLCLE
jgi:hypothetical protein